MWNKSQKSNIKSQNFLSEIVAIKRKELQKMRNTQKIDLSNMPILKSSDGLRFREVFVNKKESIRLIAEVKFASPTSPNLGTQEELLSRIKQYEKLNAHAISIITEKHFFRGDLSFVSEVKDTVSIPILQKDFIINSDQIYEAKAIGSDGLLLIARILSGLDLKKFVSLCFSLGIEPVVEINTEQDLKKATVTKTNIIAVNARDLETFAVDIAGACKLLKKIPDTYIKLGFSGIHSRKEVMLYKEAGANGILIGTKLMQVKNKEKFIKSLSL